MSTEELVESDSSVRTRGKVLFEGQDILVRGHFPGDVKTLMVSFTSRIENKATGHRKEGFGERFLDASGVAYLCFINRRNHWWQTREVENAYRAIDEEYQLSRYPRVGTYGSSMGAYGALIFSRLVRANLVLAFSPQASIAGTELPIQRQWQIDMAETPIILEPMSRGLSTTAQILIPFDPLNALDLAHVRALEKLRHCQRLVVPMSGHKTSMFLHECGMLKSIVLDGIGAPVEAAKLRQWVRQARRSSPRYWMVLAARYKQRRRPDLALAAEKQCFECVVASGGEDSERHEAARRYVERLIAARQGRQAIDFARQWATTYASSHEAHDLYSRALIARGKVKTAITEARTAVGLRPRYAPLQLRLAALLADNGYLDLASRHIQAALKGGGAKGADWLYAARAFARGGDSETSRLAAQQGLAVETSNEKIIGQLRACAA